MLPDSLIVRIVVSLPPFLLAIILHEVAHGYVAYVCGDDTAKREGPEAARGTAEHGADGRAAVAVQAVVHGGFGLDALRGLLGREDAEDSHAGALVGLEQYQYDQQYAQDQKNNRYYCY